jgi:hypothetical protein
LLNRQQQWRQRKRPLAEWRNAPSSKQAIPRVSSLFLLPFKFDVGTHFVNRKEKRSNPNYMGFSSRSMVQPVIGCTVSDRESKGALETMRADGSSLRFVYEWWMAAAPVNGAT